MRERLGAWRGAFSLLLGTGQACTAQDVAEGTSCRPHHVWLKHLQPCLELPRAPGRMLGPKRKDGVLDRLQRRVGTTMRAAAAIYESFRPRLVVAIDPAVAGWAGDSILTAQVRY